MKRLLILLVILLLIAVVAGAGYLGYQSSKPTTATTIQAPPTIAAARGDVSQVVSAPGILVSARDVTLSLSTGGRISKMAVRVGDHV
ncbi:MAG: hypothetical protein AB1817_18270, partial [Chloroflexota bacterium]